MTADTRMYLHEFSEEEIRAHLEERKTTRVREARAALDELADEQEARAAITASKWDLTITNTRGSR